MNTVITKRTEWVSALRTLPIEDILSTTTQLTDGWKVQSKSLPQSGLGMMKLNDSAFNEPFYLGEIPVSSAWLEVTTLEGQQAEGAAQVMDDRVELAEALALCDAILSAQLSGWEQVASMVDKGMKNREKTRLERKRILAHTKVDFSLLDDVGDEDAKS